MNYLNGSPSIARTPEFLRATLPQRAVWFSLWAYCHEQNNGGKIGNAEDWTDEMWQGIGVHPETVKKDCSLYRMGGAFLIVHFYNLKAESDYLKKIAKGSEYAMRRWEKQNAPKPVKDGSPNGSPIGSPNGIPNAYVCREVSNPSNPPQTIPPSTPQVDLKSEAPRQAKRKYKLQRPK